MGSQEGYNEDKDSRKKPIEPTITFLNIKKTSLWDLSFLFDQWGGSGYNVDYMSDYAKL